MNEIWLMAGMMVSKAYAQLRSVECQMMVIDPIYPTGLLRSIEFQYMARSAT